MIFSRHSFCSGLLREEIISSGTFLIKSLLYPLEFLFMERSGAVLIGSCQFKLSLESCFSFSGRDELLNGRFVTRGRVSYQSVLARRSRGPQPRVRAAASALEALQPPQPAPGAGRDEAQPCGEAAQKGQAAGGVHK